MKNEPKIAPGLLIILALFAPFLLLPIEKLLPYPHVIEELAKLAMVFIIFNLEKARRRSFLFLVVLLALLFTWSESVLYLVNLLAVGRLELFITRIFYTSLLHVGTSLLLYFMARNKYLAPIALFFSMAVHYFYNRLVVI